MAADTPRPFPEQPWMSASGAREVVAALTVDGADVRFVGGCVRDAAADRDVSDIDIATPEHPEQVLARLKAAAIKAIPTGLKHGTVTAVVDGQPFEITTLRHDVETDGRHAVVDFTDDWEADARRRDFTMNAMSLTPDGVLFDYAGGLADLEAGHVRFMGAAEDRIREDVLRLLRFYRFFAHYGRGDPDAQAIAACRALAPLLPGLSAERVRTELLKLLAAPDPAPVVEQMRGDGVLTQILPEAEPADRLAALAKLEIKADPVRRLATLLPLDRDILAEVAARLRLSNRDRDRLVAIAVAAPGFTPPGDDKARRATLYRLGHEVFEDLIWLDAADGRTDPANLAAHLAAAETWRRPVLPVNGEDLIAAGLEKGPAVGEALKSLEEIWIESDFQAGKAVLLAALPMH